jgi:hypothetical protein
MQYVLRHAAPTLPPCPDLCMQAMATETNLQLDSDSKSVTPEVLRRALCAQVQAHLHVVLCVSPSFVPRLARFAGLHAALRTIDVLSPWDEVALTDLTLAQPCHPEIRATVEYTGALGSALVGDPSVCTKLASLLGELLFPVCVCRVCRCTSQAHVYHL